MSRLEFRPSPAMRQLYWAYALICVAASVLSWSIPLAILVPEARLVVLLSVYLPLLVVLAVFAYWLDRYQRSLVYRIEDEYVAAEGGVWWRVERRVPYSKINYVIISRGPLSRRLGLADVKVHTAAMGAYRPEITLGCLSLEDAMRLRDELLRRVGKLPEEKRVPVELQMLDELRRIRGLLEQLVRR